MLPLTHTGARPLHWRTDGRLLALMTGALGLGTACLSSSSTHRQRRHPRRRCLCSQEVLVEQQPCDRCTWLHSLVPLINVVCNVHQVRLPPPHTHTYTHTHAHDPKQACTRVHKHACTRTLTHPLNMLAHTDTHTHAHTQARVHTHTHKHMHAHVLAHTRKHMHTDTHTHIHAHMRKYMKPQGKCVHILARDDKWMQAHSLSHTHSLLAFVVHCSTDG